MSFAGNANPETLVVNLINGLMAKRDLLTAHAMTALRSSRELTRSGTYYSEVDAIMANANTGSLQNPVTFYNNKGNGSNPAQDAHSTAKLGG